MRSRLRSEAAVLLLAWQFLTRIPPPRAPAWSAARMAAAPRWFPAVGLVVGLVGAGVLAGTAALLPAVVAVLLSLSATVAMTGALHEDGLADSFDGLGATTRDQALAIMRDSVLGAFGAVGLGLTLALKVAALAAMPVGLAAAALVAAHAGSRLSCLVVIATSRYLRPVGTGGFTAAGVGYGGLALGGGAVLLASLGVALHGVAALGLALAGLVAGHLGARLVFERRLGGYTGDTLGAVQQLSEVGVYLGLLLWL